MGSETQNTAATGGAEQGQLPLGGEQPAQVDKIAAAPAQDGTAAAAPKQTQDAAKVADAKVDDKGKAAGDKPPADPFADWKPKPPDGVETADPELVKVAKAVAKDAKSADALVSAFYDLQKRQDEAWVAQREKTVAGWRESFKSDQEIGGADAEANAKAADRALTRLGTPALRQLLEDTGLNAHPEIARLLVRAEKATGEDRIAGKTNGAAVADPRNDGIDYRRLYPHTPSLHPKT